VSGRLLVAEWRVEREVAQAEVPITHLIVDRLVDRSDLLSRLVEIGGDTSNSTTPDQDWTEKALGRADEVRRSEPGSQRPKPKLPGSRDFR
jgi:error-prone DNA polymerase